MDYTIIFRALIVIIVAFLSYALAHSIVPWLKEKRLYEAAVVAVGAAEALFGRYHGEEKLQYAFDYMHRSGIKFDDAAIMDALRAAWEELNRNMILSGQKKIEEKSDAE